MTLTEVLLTVEDPRSARGLRHELHDVLLMCIMAVMSGYTGYGEAGRFLYGNRRELQQSPRLLHGVPSHVTVRDVLQRVDFEKFASAFNTWAIRYVSMCKGDTKALDGKAIRSTVDNCGSSHQNSVGLTGIFASQRGTVPGCGKIENKKESEIPKVHELIKALDVKGEILTLDALHCQKKRRTQSCPEKIITFFRSKAIKNHCSGKYGLIQPAMPGVLTVSTKRRF